MSNNRDRREFRHAHWQRCQALGMTQKDYGKREGLTVTVFYGWTQRFKREASAVSSFRQVTVMPATPAQYRLCFPNGLVLEWCGQPDVEQLSRLAKHLR